MHIHPNKDMVDLLETRMGFSHGIWEEKKTCIEREKKSTVNLISKQSENNNWKRWNILIQH